MTFQRTLAIARGKLGVKAQCCLEVRCAHQSDTNRCVSHHQRGSAKNFRRDKFRLHPHTDEQADGGKTLAQHDYQNVRFR